MPATVTIHPGLKLVISKFIGEANESDLDEVTKAVPSLLGFDATFSHIIDFSEVSSFNISSSFLQELAHRQPVFAASARQIVVAPQPNIYGLSRMTQTLREPLLPNIAVVKTIQEAHRILKIED
ncbi:MAG TPA: hypothetical protein VHA06_08055 [Candidatus Angelobacter sp.]|jgi:hypothetical protein|nr:hypothetical protein [Candidatus Angelobacter sp.]